MNIIPFSNTIAQIFTVEYWDMQYLRWGNQQKVKKKEHLFDIDGDNMKLLPNAPFILEYTWYKEVVHKYFKIWWYKLDKKLLDIKYTWTPSSEQAEILTNIMERSTVYWYHWWLVVMKTGRGKSHMIAQTVAFHKQKTIISVHNIKTLHEMVEKLSIFLWGNFRIWEYYGQKKKMWDIIVTTHTSLNKCNWRIVIKWEEFKPKILMYDEADRNLSHTMIQTFCNMDLAWMYGLTWTPQAKHLTEKDLNKIFWKSIRSDKWWYNLVPVVKYIRYRTTEDYRFTNYHELRECLMWDQDRLDAQVKYIKHVMKYRQCWLLMSDRRLEVEAYYEELKDEWYEVILIHGDTKVKDDNELIEKTVYSWKKTLIIWTSGKMSRWVDIPPIDTIFLFYPNKFESATIQAVGRWLRKFDNKINTLLVDWCDYPIMKNQMYERWKTYRNEYGVEISKSNEAKAID